jgi:hypothetical protein
MPAFDGEFIRLHAHKLFSLPFFSSFVLSDSESEFNKPKSIVHRETRSAKCGLTSMWKEFEPVAMEARRKSDLRRSKVIAC